LVGFYEVAIGEGGVLGCRRCTPAAAQGAVHPADSVIRCLDEIAAAVDGDRRNVSFVGMEPFRHPELPLIVGAASQRGFARIRLVTDGGALARGGNAAGVIAAGVRQVELVLLGPPAVHDDLSGRPGLFAAAESGVASFVRAAESAGAAVAVSSVLRACPHNAAELPAAVAAAARLGVGAIVIDVADLKASQTNQDVVFAALDTATVNRVAASLRGWPDEGPAIYRRAPWDLCEVGE
jgi:molybdenum cofactor biosynthesis enzyme MoaA